MKNKALKITAFALLFSVMLALSAVFYVYCKNNGVESLENFVSRIGVWGYLVMFLLQVLQVVFAVIPGEPVELVMGALFGTFGGTLMCLVGCIAGTVIIFGIVRLFGKGFLDTFGETEKFSKLKFLKNPEKRDIFVFLLMFIPGTPKDLLTYFAPFSGISLVRFLIISSIARIPSIASSAYVGNTFADGAYVKSIIIYAVVGVTSISGIIIYNKIVEHHLESK